MPAERPLRVSWQAAIVTAAATTAFIAAAWIRTADRGPPSHRVFADVTLAAAAAGGVAVAAACGAAGPGRRRAVLAGTGLGVGLMSAAAGLSFLLRGFLTDTAGGIAVVVVPAGVYLAGVERVVRAMSRRRE